MIYKKYNGNSRYVTIPAREMSLSQEVSEPYTTIGVKAFLSHKEIEQLILPDSITTIEDWAFAHMQQLKELVLPANPIHFGRKVFLDCNQLRRIQIRPDHSSNPGLPLFLADLVTVFSNTDLLNPVLAASESTHAAWMQEYDRLLTHFLKENDEAGFEPVFYGWFNDEDPDSTQRPTYILTQRAHKVRMTFTRLRYPLFLSPTCREILQAYMRDHMPWGCKAREHTAVWDLLPEYYAEEVCYYQLLQEADALPPEKIPEILAHLPQASPEVIAWLLRYREQSGCISDFFDNFTL